MFRDNPDWVPRKLEWNPRHPRTPPPTSAKFLGSLWKNDCRTNKQPLQVAKKKESKITSEDKHKTTFHGSSDKSVLFSSMLSQDDIKHSQGFHTILIFLATYHICYGLHRNLGSKTKFNFEGFWVVRASYSLSITLIWIITPIRTRVTIIIPTENKMASTISNRIQLQK